MADLLVLASMAATDPNAIPVLGDAIIEAGWQTPDRTIRIMGLCLGVPLDHDPPDSIQTREGRTAWRRRRLASLEFAAKQWDVYAVGGRKDWGRAVLAEMLFGEWMPARHQHSMGSRSPWLLVWRNATAQGRARAAQRRAWQRSRAGTSVAVEGMAS